jgi:NodT family efflux transporter outer membrane factor (OMF) lipoprotein
MMLFGLVACGPKTLQVHYPLVISEKFSSSGKADMPDEWWDVLGDKELSRVIGRAMKGNIGLKIAWDRIDQARALAAKSGAGMWPSVDYKGNIGTGLNKQGNVHQMSLGVAASYELDLWGRVRALRDAASLDVQASEQDVQSTSLSLAAEVAGTWYQLAEKYGQIKLLDEQLATNQKVLALVLVRFRLGQASAADVLQQRQTVESKRGEKTQVMAYTRVLEHQLALLLGDSPIGFSVGQKASLIDLPPLPSTGVPSQLIQRRPDVRSAYLRVQAAHRRVASAIAEQFPRFSLAAGGSISAEGVGNLVGNWLLNLAANVMGPIFDGGARRAEVARIRALASEAFHNYGQTILKAFKEVEDALSREQYQSQLLQSLNLQVELLAEVVERTRYSYANGAETYLRVLDALLRHQVLQRTQLAARQELIIHRISLCRALAGSWQLQRPTASRSSSVPVPTKKVE